MLNIIILSIIAAAIAYRLYKTLGDSRYENDTSNQNSKAYEDYKDFVLNDADKNDAMQKESLDEYEFNEQEKQVIAEIRKAVPAFTIQKFLKGAKIAFEEILKAYSNQDESTLKQLSSGQAFKDFMNDINFFKSNNQIKNVNLVSILNTKILSIIRNDSMVTIKVELESEQISNVTDKVSGSLINGSLSKIMKRIDTFNFEKNINSDKNIWLLVSNEN